MPERRSQRASFEEAALSHLEALYRFAVYLCRNDSEAEDLTQDTYLSALQKAHQFEPGTNLKAWLFRIARNAHIDKLRRRKREADLAERKESSHRPEAGIAPASFDRWRGLGLDKQESSIDVFGDEVSRSLQELPSDFRVALILCDVEGLSYQEISEVLNCPVGTVRSRISRARNQLRDNLHTFAAEHGYVRGKTGD